MARPTPSLLGLPQELRDQIYDEILTGIVEPHEIKDDIYLGTNEWPRTDEWGSAYYNLLLAGSAQIHDEVTSRFHDTFLPRLRLNFRNVPDLLQYRQAIEEAGPQFEDTPFSLRMPAPLFTSKEGVQPYLMEILRLMQQYTDHNIRALRTFHAFHSMGDVGDEEWYECDRCGLRRHVTYQGPQKDDMINTYHFLSTGDMQVLAREKAGVGESRYYELRGRIGDLETEELDEILAAEKRRVRGQKTPPVVAAPSPPPRKPRAVKGRAVAPDETDASSSSTPEDAPRSARRGPSARREAGVRRTPRAAAAATAEKPRLLRRLVRGLRPRKKGEDEMEE
ncbi:hypothetical protein LTR01_000683 [Friedmanniomyces endolithicus]|nr:hypothetical protein LTR01_000683 [Friedmanniomyces endolithicus]KAK0827120.1 hypothetical protein LTR73_005903 [Friedmanniomyces endolithicus]